MFISLRESEATGFKKWSVSLQPKQVGDENTTAENTFVTSDPSSNYSLPRSLISGYRSGRRTTGAGACT
jgi:hypothetical protein